MADPTLERLTNLLVLLRETPSPLTLEEIADRLPAYRDDAGRIRRTLFERDKATLGEGGYVLERVVLGGARAGATAYCVDTERSELPDLDLTPDERRALSLALGLVHLATDGSGAATKLGAAAPAPGDLLGPLVVSLPEPAVLPVVHAAVSERRVLHARYGDKDRELRPYGLALRDGFWYLVAAEAGTEQPWKVFRLDRMDEPASVGEPGGFEPPPGFRAADALPADFRAVGEGEPVEALVLVAAVRADRVVRDLGPEAVVEQREDGSVVVRVPATNLPVFRAWVLGMLDHAEVLGPPPVRAHLRDWLAAAAGRRP